jgi:hypothetical protein
VVTNPNFGVFYKLLTLTQEEVKEEIQRKVPEEENIPTPFEYLLLSAQYVNGFSTILRGAFCYFCKTDISFMFEEHKIIIGNIEELVQTIDSIDDI